MTMNEREIFAEAMQISAAEDRLAFLDKSCIRLFQKPARSLVGLLFVHRFVKRRVIEVMCPGSRRKCKDPVVGHLIESAIGADVSAFEVQGGREQSKQRQRSPRIQQPGCD